MITNPAEWIIQFMGLQLQHISQSATVSKCYYHRLTIIAAEVKYEWSFYSGNHPAVDTIHI